jgi:quinol monooxygenase YgiN
MYVVVARFTAKPGSEDEVARLLAEMTPHALSEPECHMYIVNRLVDDPAVFLLYEQYTDAAGFAAHGETEEFKRIVAGQVVPLLDGRSREIYEVVEPVSQSEVGTP